MPGQSATTQSTDGTARPDGLRHGVAAMPLVRADRLVATLSLMLASAMQAADATIANVALPQLESDLGGGVVVGAWIITSYLCAAAVVAPLTGWLRRRFGARLLFTGAVGSFAAASLLCALAPSAIAVILFRILQGAGGGVIHPLAQAILLDLYPRERHGRMLASWGAVVMLGPIVGPALGGIITDAASWRWVFAINLPLGAAAIWGLAASLPKSEPTLSLPIDLVGVALLALGVGALQLSLARCVGRPLLGSPELLAEAAIAAAAFALLAARSQGFGFAVFRLAVFRDLNFAAAVLYNFITSALLFVVIVFVPALLQGPLGYSATAAGMTIVPRGIATMLVMLLVGKLIQTVECRILLAGGILLMVIGFYMLAAAPPAGALSWIVIGSTLQAVGGGALITSLSTVGFSTLAPEMRTDAAGVYSLMRQLGCASGVALMAAVLHGKLEANLTGTREALRLASDAVPAKLADMASLHAYSGCFRALAVASLLMLPGVLVFRLRRSAAAGRP